MALSKKQKIGWGITLGVAVLGLIIFIIYFAKRTKPAPKAEMCPDGVTPIPAGGQCPAPKLIPVKSASGATTYVTPAPKPDANGCLQPSSYGAASLPLGLGMSGSQVVQWQTYLNSQYNAGLSTDGYFGCLT